MEKTREETATQTRIVAALVVATTFDGFDELKQTAQVLGCKIIFQKTAAPWVRLWIVEKDREDEGP